jgi:hypothetical protein
MKSMNSHRPIRAWLILLLIVILCWAVAVRADRSGWQRQEVNLRMTGGARIKAISYPREELPPLRAKRDGRQPTPPREKTLLFEAASRLTEESTTPIFANVIDSPPIDGFVPWIAVTVTNARSDDFDFFAYETTYIVGDYLTTYPEVDYAIGLFDTGAAATIMGNADATQTGVSNANLYGPLTIEIAGATGSVEAIVSFPFGLFIDGLGAIGPSSPTYPNGLLDMSAMVGEWNTSIALGQVPQQGAPDLPTAIGSPLSVYFAADFKVDQQVTVTHNSEEFTGPPITFYAYDDPCIPTYSNRVTLELRPAGGAVAYWPFIDPGTFEVYPMTPSVIMGDQMQSLFFFPEVDLAEPNGSATEQDEFIFDTGAQVTVIGSTIAARLGLNPAKPNFEVEILDVTGEVTIKPGFYLDSIEIPATGQWLSFTNVPVVMLDIASPEGGFLDGIIGMNLFVEYNFVFNGGAMDIHKPPYLEFEPIPYHIVADIAPLGGDGKVEFQELAEFAQDWLAIPISENWNSKADMVGDAIINFLDFTVLAEYWQQSISP